MRRTPTFLPGRAARVLAAGLVMAAGALASLGGMTPAGAQGCGPAPAGKVAVVVVVDTGSGAPLSRCVIVPAGSTGAVALTAAIGSDQVRTGAGVVGKGDGFVCGLLGLPATGCVNADGQRSWIYWHATPGGQWNWARSSFAAYPLPSPCTVEGWAYGPPNTKPRIAPPAVTCEAPATTLPPRATAAPAVPGVSPPGRPTGATGPAAAPGGPAPTPVGTAAPTTAAPGAAPTTAPAAVAGATTVAAPTSTTVASTTAEAPARDDEVATAPVVARQRGGSGPGFGLIVGLVVAAALAGVAVVRSRRQRVAAEQGV